MRSVSSDNFQGKNAAHVANAGAGMAAKIAAAWRAPALSSPLRAQDCNRAFVPREPVVSACATSCRTFRHARHPAGKQLRIGEFPSPEKIRSTMDDTAAVARTCVPLTGLELLPPAWRDESRHSHTTWVAIRIELNVRIPHAADTAVWRSSASSLELPMR